MYRKRLRNVYELLETGNNRKVITEVDKLILETTTPASGQKNKKRVPKEMANEPGYDEQVTMVIGKALKALALVRVARRNEGDLVMQEVLDSNTSDENALNVVMQYCKETHQAAKIVEFYERAVKKFEENKHAIGTGEHEDILISLFYAYARLRDFNNQQKIALKLYKQTNKMMYCFWNAASYVMMAQEENNGLTDQLDLAKKQQKGMFMVLAEKILQKAYNDKKMEYNGEFLLYLNILEGKHLYEEALQIVNDLNEGELSQIGQIDFKVKRKLSYFKKMKKWTGLKFTSEQFIEHESNDNIDDWLVYLDYIESVVELYKTTGDNELKNNLIKESLDFFNRLISKIETPSAENQAPKAQSPYLGRLELLNRIITSMDTDPAQKFVSIYLDQIKQFLVSYINQFVGKPGFFFDFIVFQQFVINLKLQDFVLGHLKETQDKHLPFKSIKCIYSCLSYWQIHRRFGMQKKYSDVEYNQLASQLEDLYTQALDFGKELLPTSMQYADEFLIMAVHIRYELAKRNTSCKENNLLRIVANLKHGLTNSPSNFQLKLLLLNIYSHLGAYEPLQEMYKSMEIKNIQNYSTANLLIVHNMRLGSIASATNSYTSIGHFFLSNLFDMSNFLVHCYKYGSFLKAVEIHSFINHIRRSLSLVLCLNNFIAISFIMQPTVSAAANSTTDVSTPEDDLQDFKNLHSTISNHLKEMSTVSAVFDKNGLLPDDIEALKASLLDHTDKEVTYNWDADEDKNLSDKQYEVVLTEQRVLLKLRNLMIRYTNVLLTHNLDNLNKDKEQALDSSLSLYRNKLVEFDYNYNYFSTDEDTYDANLKIHVTKSFYMKRWSMLGLNQLVSTFVGLSSDLVPSNVLKFLGEEMGNGQKCLSAHKANVDSIFEMVQKEINQLVLCLFEEKKLTPEHLPRLIECFSALVEAVSFISVIFTVCLSNETFKPVWNEKIKKAKKKKSQYLQHDTAIDLIFEIYKTLCRLIYYLNMKLEQTVCPRVVSLTNEACKNTTTTFKQSKLVEMSELAAAYSKSFEEIKTVLSAKLKYLLKFSDKTMAMEFDKMLEKLSISEQQ